MRKRSTVRRVSASPLAPRDEERAGTQEPPCRPLPSLREFQRSCGHLHPRRCFGQRLLSALGFIPGHFVEAADVRVGVVALERCVLDLKTVGPRYGGGKLRKAQTGFAPKNGGNALAGS